MKSYYSDFGMAPNSKEVVIPGPVCTDNRPRFTGKFSYMSKKYRQWQKTASYFVKQGTPTLGEAYVYIKYICANKREFSKDVDNIAKSILDLLQLRGWYKDDRQVTRLEAIKAMGCTTETVVHVYKLEDNNAKKTK